MAQFARPDSNVTQTSFTNGFAEIDEASPSDADFAWGANNTAAELEVGLTNPTDPSSSTGHIFRYRIAKTNAGTVDGGGNAVTVTARLMQSTTQIATDTAKTADGTWTQYDYTLSGAEADSITDYTDLRLEFVTSASGGSPANRRGGAVSWAELETPDAGSQTFPQEVTTTAGTAATMSRQTNKGIAGTVASIGSVTKRVELALANAVPTAASLEAVKVVLKVVSTTVATSASVSREVSKVVSTAVAAASTFTREMTKSLAAAVATSSTLESLRVFVREITASAAAAASHSVRVDKLVNASVGITSSLGKVISKVLSTALSLATSLATEFQAGGGADPVSGDGSDAGSPTATYYDLPRPGGGADPGSPG